MFLGSLCCALNHKSFASGRAVFHISLITAPWTLSDPILAVFSSQTFFGAAFVVWNEPYWIFDFSDVRLYRLRISSLIEFFRHCQKVNLTITLIIITTINNNNKNNNNNKSNNHYHHHHFHHFCNFS